MTGLTKYDAARHALQAAISVDEVKDIRDKAAAMAEYARQAANTEMIEWATEIKVRAERRAGQMLAEMPKNPGKLANSSRSHDATTTKTLEEIGVSKTQSSRWQKLASVPDEKFEQAVSAAKEVAGEVTTAAMLRFERSLNPKKETIPSTPTNSPQPQSNPPPPENDAQPEFDEKDYRIECLVEENERLANLAAAGAFIGTDEERAALAQRLDDLVAENKHLRTLNAGLIASRDKYMRENAEMRKQLQINAKKLKAAKC